MGWMRTLFLGDIGNQLDIADNRRDLEAVRASLHTTGYHQRAVDEAQTEQIAAMQNEIEDLQLTIASLCRLLVARGLVAEADIDAFVAKLDT